MTKLKSLRQSHRDVVPAMLVVLSWMYVMLSNANLVSSLVAETLCS